MPRIKPFKGIRYNSEKIKKLFDVVTQPYDQISNEMEQQYKDRSPYNFVRLILTKYAEGHDRQKEYKDAKKYSEKWIKEQIFMGLIDSAPNIILSSSVRYLSIFGSLFIDIPNISACLSALLYNGRSFSGM